MKGSKRRGVVRIRFEDLLPEIISDILARLPMEWILICKCVCKAWHALIKEDNFVKLQLHRTNDLPPSHVILESFLDVSQSMSGKINKFLVDIQDHSSTNLASLIARVPLPDTVTNMNLKIMCSLNGLICLASEFFNTYPVVVCNPIITGDFIILPKSEYEKTVFGRHHVTLGFDHLINKYKAVRVSMYYDGSISASNRRCFFEVITIGQETSRRQVLNRDNDLMYRVTRGGVFHQGSIYWIMDRCPISGSWESNNPNGDYILEFDVSKEVFQAISFPQNMRRPSFRTFRQGMAILETRLQIIGGAVALMQIDKQDDQLLHIWQIVRGGNWNDRAVEYSSIRISLPSKIRHARVIALLHPNSGVDDFLMLERPPGRHPIRVNQKKRRETEFLYYFPFSSSSMKCNRYITLPGLEIQSYDNFVAWCYKPSLVSVKMDLLGQH